MDYELFKYLNPNYYCQSSKKPITQGIHIHQFVLIIHTLQKMSKKYSTSNDSFYPTQAKIRQIVQIQIQQFFDGIKEEIQSKIIDIDKNINIMQRQISQINFTIKNNSNNNKNNNQINQTSEQSVKNQNYEQIVEKIQKLEERIQILAQKQMENTISIMQQVDNKIIQKLNNYEKKDRDRSPLFRKSKTGPTIDLDNLLFGSQQTKNNERINNGVEQSKISANSKPPLPKNKYNNLIPNAQSMMQNENNPQFGQRTINQMPNSSNNVNNYSLSTSILSLSSSSASMSSTVVNNNNNSQCASKGINQYQTMGNSIPKNLYSTAAPNEAMLNIKNGRQLQSPLQEAQIHKNISSQKEQQKGESKFQQEVQKIPQQIIENLNKNKNSFMRKKSLKKIGIIQEQQVEESVLSIH